MLYNDLPICFPWYDSLDKQNTKRVNVEVSKMFRLITPRDALLPFEILIENEFLVSVPTKWEILDQADNVLVDISNSIYLIQGRIVSSGTYLFYNGDRLTANLEGANIGLNLPEGCYYSRLSFSNRDPFYSEVFAVPQNSFSIQDSDKLINYMKVSFTNTSDIPPVLYSGNGDVRFTQYFYLDTYVHSGEPEIEEDGERDGDNTLIPTFQKMTVSYVFSELVPDYLKFAITSLQLHDTVNIVTAKGVRSGSIDYVTTESEVQDNGAYSTITVRLRQLMMSRNSCSGDMAQDSSQLPADLFSTDLVYPNYQLSATAGAGIIVAANQKVAIIPVTPGVRYYIVGWGSVLTRRGWFGPGSPANPTSLPVVLTGAVTRSQGIYTEIAPAGSSYLAISVKNATEADSVYATLHVWGDNPGMPFIIRAQTLSTTSTLLTAGIPANTFGTISASQNLTGTYTVLETGLTPAQLLAGRTMTGQFTYWKVSAKNFNTDYGDSYIIVRSA